MEKSLMEKRIIHVPYRTDMGTFIAMTVEFRFGFQRIKHYDNSSQQAQ